MALSLFTLIGVGGIAFDYSRMASMDTELQNAADQAALAAATQLDGEAGARARATSAAQNLVENLTYFANDGGGDAITVPTIIFYRDYDPETGAKGPVAASDADANYVLVTVGARTANYALTPVVAAFSSGEMEASAFATLDSAWCNLPPFMVCAPTGGNFDPDDHVGHGLHLVIGAPNTPGNFGFLQTGFGTGANNLAKAVGWDGSAGGCVATRGGVPTEPGDKVSVRAAVNTRFDMSESGQTCPAGGTCSPSTNSRKDVVHADGPPYNNQNCRSGGNRGWSETANPYRRPDATPIPTTGPFPDVMGHPPDLCHMSDPFSNGCGIVGDGNWDRDAFFKVNYNWDPAGSATVNDWTMKTGLPANATRYQVYLWEAANPTPTATHGIGHQQGPFVVGNETGGGSTQKWTDSQAVCRPPGTPPTDPAQDRRRTSVAVINCTGNDPSGRDEVNPLAWMDVFLVEPSFRRPPRTDGDEIYAEIIRSKPLPEIGQTVDNIVRRDVPRLIE